ncbi:Hypothetical protein YALI2_A00143g [Yarrowia lipolytica]|nr:Hypothetical protein YALI2_A00143g [Yarrowia lipolytica]
MTSTSSSSRAQILATGTPPMFASAKNAIISNVRSLKVPSASGYLAKDVEPTQSVTPFTLSSSVSPATTASANPTSAVSVAQTNFVSRTGVSECSTEVPASEGPKPTSEAPAASPTLSASVDLTTKVTIVEGITKTLTDASTIAPAPYGESKPEPKPELSEGKPAPSGGR